MIMSFKSQYEKQKKEFFSKSNKAIPKFNLNLMKLFFEKTEKRLRQNTKGKKFAVLDEKNYKTLVSFFSKFKNIQKWLGNIELKPTKEFEKKFEKVYNKLIEGKILKKNGKPLEDKRFYMDKVFRGRRSLFTLAGLSNIVEKVTEDYKSNNEVVVEWLEEKPVEKIIDNSNGIYKTLYQLDWDIGENISSFILTKKSDYKKQFNEVTKEYEYLVTLRRETLKRTRTARIEPTRFSKTVELLDEALKDLKDDDYVFCRDDSKININDKNKGKRIPMTLRSVEKHFDKVVKKLKLKTISSGESPKNNRPTLKHLRTSMACDCLKKGWSCEEINARLGHELNSDVLKPYINALALDKNKPKVREYKANVSGLNDKLDEQKQTNALLERRIEEMQKRMDALENLANFNVQKLIKKGQKDWERRNKENIEMIETTESEQDTRNENYNN